MNKGGDFDVLDIEDETQFGSRKGESFSHPVLVMLAFRKVIENGSKEMREGYMNTKFDKFGNAHKVWIPDSRMEFIESVETLKMILKRDFDDPAKEEIKKLEEELKDKYESLCEKEKDEWKKININLKRKLENEGSRYREGMLSRSLPYVFEYIEEKVRIYREITEKLGELIKRIGEYGEEYAVG